MRTTISSFLIATLLATPASAASSGAAGGKAGVGGSPGDDALRRIERELDRLWRSLESDLPRIERQRSQPPANEPETVTPRASGRHPR